MTLDAPMKIFSCLPFAYGRTQRIAATGKEGTALQVATQ